MVLKIYCQVFFFNSENLLSSIERTWVHLYFPFGKFNLDMRNKVADNNGTALPHETDFDIIKDRFFELIYLSGDLKTINCRRLPLKAEICSASK